MGLNTEDVISLEDILAIYDSVDLIPEPKIPFPQLDVFDLVLNLCESLYINGSLSPDDIKNIFSLKNRQYSYCKGACEYLGLVEKTDSNLIALTPLGLKLFALNDKHKKLGIVKLILQHKPFYDAFSLYLGNGDFPTSNDMFEILKNNEIYNLKSEVTLRRRSSTVKGWMNWIISLISLV